MPKTMPCIDDLIKGNPKVNAKQIAELDQLRKKLADIPPGTQRVPSPIVRRRIVLGEGNQSDRRTIRLSTHR